MIQNSKSVRLNPYEESSGAHSLSNERTPRTDVVIDLDNLEMSSLREEVAKKFLVMDD